MRSALLIPMAVIALAGCASPRAAPPVVTVAPPPPRPVAPPPAPLAADWNDWPYTPGEWSYRRSDEGTLAMFGTAGIMLRCDLARRTVMLRVDGAAGSVTVRTTTMTRVIPVTASANVSIDGSATLAANDPLLDAMIFSRGRFVIERAGLPPLVAPPHAEIGRVVEDCRG